MLKMTVLAVVVGVIASQRPAFTVHGDRGGLLVLARKEVAPLLRLSLERRHSVVRSVLCLLLSQDDRGHNGERRINPPIGETLHNKGVCSAMYSSACKYGERDTNF